MTHAISCEVHILLEESDFDEFCSELMFYGVNLCSWHSAAKRLVPCTVVLLGRPQIYWASSTTDREGTASLAFEGLQAYQAWDARIFRNWSIFHPTKDVDKSSCHAILAQGILWAHPNGHAWPGNDCHGESQSQWKGLGWASSWSHPIHI
jgi:hypothetical protein